MQVKSCGAPDQDSDNWDHSPEFFLRSELPLKTVGALLVNRQASRDFPPELLYFPLLSQEYPVTEQKLSKAQFQELLPWGKVPLNHGSFRDASGWLIPPAETPPPDIQKGTYSPAGHTPAEAAAPAQNRGLRGGR